MSTITSASQPSLCCCDLQLVIGDGLDLVQRMRPSHGRTVCARAVPRSPPASTFAPRNGRAGACRVLERVQQLVEPVDQQVVVARTRRGGTPDDRRPPRPRMVLGDHREQAGRRVAKQAFQIWCPNPQPQIRRVLEQLVHQSFQRACSVLSGCGARATQNVRRKRFGTRFTTSAMMRPSNGSELEPVAASARSDDESVALGVVVDPEVGVPGVAIQTQAGRDQRRVDQPGKRPADELAAAVLPLRLRPREARRGRSADPGPWLAILTTPSRLNGKPYQPVFEMSAPQTGNRSPAIRLGVVRAEVERTGLAHGAASRSADAATASASTPRRRRARDRRATVRPGGLPMTPRTREPSSCSRSKDKHPRAVRTPSSRAPSAPAKTTTRPLSTNPPTGFRYPSTQPCLAQAGKRLVQPLRGHAPWDVSAPTATARSRRSRSLPAAALLARHQQEADLVVRSGVPHHGVPVGARRRSTARPSRRRARRAVVHAHGLADVGGRGVGVRDRAGVDQVDLGTPAAAARWRRRVRTHRRRRPRSIGVRGLHHGPTLTGSR